MERERWNILKNCWCVTGHCCLGLYTQYTIYILDCNQCLLKRFNFPFPPSFAFLRLYLCTRIYIPFMYISLFSLYFAIAADIYINCAGEEAPAKSVYTPPPPLPHWKAILSEFLFICTFCQPRENKALAMRNE